VKQKRTYTRRQQALRWLLRLLIVLLICGSLSGVCSILPVQTVDAARRQQGLEKMEVVYSTWAAWSPMTGKRLYLSQNEDVLMLSAAAFGLGWYNYNPLGLIIDPNAPGAHAVWRVGNREQIWVCIVGFVPEEEEPPTFYVGVKATRQTGENDYLEEPMTVIPEADIPVKGGKCYLETYSFSVEGYEDFGIVVTAEKDGEQISPCSAVSTSAG